MRLNAQDGSAVVYRAYPPTGDAEGLLVLLPGYGGGLASFDEGSDSPSELPVRMAEIGFVTIVAAPQAATLYEADGPLEALDRVVDDAVARYGVPHGRIVVGGFSAGGTGALRYAEVCAEGRCRATEAVAGVFGVDPPLDFERLYRTARLTLERAAPKSNLAEAQAIVDTLERSLGGSPEEHPEAYRGQSVLLASEADGGNAALLDTTPVRLYVEPDVRWWMENRALDYAGMNAVDHATLINLLQVAGNAEADLVLTTEKGFRPSGARHPHSWSIVDEAELVAWIVRVAGI